MLTDPTDSLEAMLGELEQDAESSSQRRQQLVAFRFYLYDVIRETVDHWLNDTSGFTRYLDLLNWLLDWQQRTGNTVLLTTFNYDVLLDNAATDVVTGWTLTDVASYVNRGDFKLMKLHGSTAWSRVVNGPVPINIDMSRAAMEKAAQEPLSIRDLISVPTSDVAGADGRLLLPALALPMAGKAQFECPPEHLIALTEALPTVRYVLIIGWRAAEPHMIELLEGSTPDSGLMPGYNLVIVSKDADHIAEVKANLSDVGKKGNLRFEEPGGFRRFSEQVVVDMSDLCGLP